MPIDSPEQLLGLILRKIEDAEQQASQALKKMRAEVENEKVQQLLERRMDQGERVLKDVQSALERLGGEPRTATNKAARGLIEEAQDMAREAGSPQMKEAVTIAGAQSLEHYCIAVWGTVKAMARECGEQELAQAMDRAIDEGRRWDGEMTRIAERNINPEALEQEKSTAGQQSGARGGDRSSGGSDREERGSSADGGQGASGSDDLKSREYRDDDGNIHHHTKEYMQRKGE